MGAAIPAGPSRIAKIPTARVTATTIGIVVKNGSRVRARTYAIHRETGTLQRELQYLRQSGFVFYDQEAHLRPADG